MNTKAAIASMCAQFTDTTRHALSAKHEQSNRTNNEMTAEMPQQ